MPRGMRFQTVKWAYSTVCGTVLLTDYNKVQSDTSFSTVGSSVWDEICRPRRRALLIGTLSHCQGSHALVLWETGRDRTGQDMRDQIFP